MDLYLEDNETNPAVKYQATSPTGYTITTNPLDWDKYCGRIGMSYKKFRNELVTRFNGSWGTYSNDQKKALERHYVYPNGATNVYTQSELDNFQELCMEKLGKCADCRPSLSNVAGSKKYFDARTDDAGIMDPQEITTFDTLA